MEKAKGRSLVPIPENKVYSKIIFCIASGNNYTQKIAGHLKKDTGNLTKQLSFLEKKGYLKSKQDINKKVFPMSKIRYYQINYEKIIQDFLSFAQEIIQSNWKANLSSSKLKGDEKTTLQIEKNHQKFKDIIKSPSIKKNLFLQEQFKILFEKSFEYYIKNNIKYTFKTLFSKILRDPMNSLPDPSDLLRTKIVYDGNPLPFPIETDEEKNKSFEEKQKEKKEKEKIFQEKFSKLKEKKLYLDFIEFRKFAMVFHTLNRDKIIYDSYKELNEKIIEELYNKNSQNGFKSTKPTETKEEKGETL